jgi:hypothetical protein
MIRSALLGFAAFVLGSATANAATYTGTLNGMITSGYEDYSDILNPGSFYKNDLTGDLVNINFTSTTLHNYTDPDDGRFYPTFVENTFLLQIPAVTNGLGDTSTTVNTDSHEGLPTSADFSGNATNGSFDGTGYWFPDPDAPVSFSVNYANASPTTGPLTGTGNANVGFYDGISVNTNVVVAFKLTDGSVSTGTPEPEAWALMIVGFCAVGGMLRFGRSRQTGTNPRPA